MAPYREPERPEAPPREVVVFKQPVRWLLVGPLLAIYAGWLLIALASLVRQFDPAALAMVVVMALFVLVPRPRTHIALSGRSLTVKPAAMFAKPRTLDLDDIAEVAVDPHLTWRRLVLVLASKERLLLMTSRKGSAIEEYANELDAWVAEERKRSGLDAQSGSPPKPTAFAWRPKKTRPSKRRRRRSRNASERDDGGRHDSRSDLSELGYGFFLRRVLPAVTRNR